MTTAAEARPFDVLAIGRVGVDLYPLQDGVGLEDVSTFGKFLGGSAANVAVAAARYGARTALVSRTGADPFGRFVRRELTRLGVDARFVGEAGGLNTPITFCVIFPPDHFPLYFYRDPIAPDLTVPAADLDLEAVRSARILWATVTGLSREPSCGARRAAWAIRDRLEHTVLDLDYRPTFWDSPDEAREQVRAALPHVTVAVGNREECEIAVGETDPDRAADALLEEGIGLAIVKRGPLGVLAKTSSERVEVPPARTRVVNGLGAGDAFGGALCHGLLAGWDLERTLRWANAAGAIVAGRRECATAMPDATEVRRLLEGGTPMPDFDRVRQIPTSEPRRIAEVLRARRRRPLTGEDGRLFIVAADHPARGALGVAARGSAMASRLLLLERLVVALGRPGVDGVLGTPDIIEDLALLGALDDMIVVGSMNRGGLQGSSFEMDDRFTAYDVPSMRRDGIDVAKLLLRINLEDPATAATLESAASAVTAAAAAELPIMLEPFMSRWHDGRVGNVLTADAVIRSTAIATGLGASSACTWLKLPVVPDMERVAEATTMPTLLLGGDPVTGQDETFASWQAALALPGIRGLVVGRTLLYPPDGDVERAVDTAARNVAAVDAFKHGTQLPVISDARRALDALSAALVGWRVGPLLEERVRREKAEWDGVVDAALAPSGAELPGQAEIIGAVLAASDATDVLVQAAGSLPGDLHKLWRVRDPLGCHVEYAFSTMGYEIAGGLGVRRAAPDRDVLAMVGDGSYLMLHTESVTAVAEGLKIVVILVQNHGYASIGHLSETVGSDRFGTKYRLEDGAALDVPLDVAEERFVPIDLAANARSYGVDVIEVRPGPDVTGRLGSAVRAAKASTRTTLIHVDADPSCTRPTGRAGGMCRSLRPPPCRARRGRVRSMSVNAPESVPCSARERSSAIDQGHLEAVEIGSVAVTAVFDRCTVRVVAGPIHSEDRSAASDLEQAGFLDRCLASADPLAGDPEIHPSETELRVQSGPAHRLLGQIVESRREVILECRDGDVIGEPESPQSQHVRLERHTELIGDHRAGRHGREFEDASRRHPAGALQIVVEARQLDLTSDRAVHDLRADAAAADQEAFVDQLLDGSTVRGAGNPQPLAQ